MAKLLCRYFSSAISKKFNDNFCIYGSKDFANIPQGASSLNKAGYATIKVLGSNLPRITDWGIQFDGEWKNVKKYGWEFIATSYYLIAPDTKKGIATFLASKAFGAKGVGKQLAEAIVSKFGNDTLNVIEKEPSKLLTVKGVTTDKLGTIVECYKKNIGFSKLCSYLANFGISQNIASKIYGKYEETAIDKIKENPYVIQDIRGVGFKTCEKIARLENVALDSFVRIDGAIREVLKVYCETTGNVCMMYDEFEKQCLNLLNNGYSYEIVPLKALREVLANLHERKQIFCKGNKYVFSKEYEQAEENIAHTIVSLANKKLNVSEKKIEDAISTFLVKEKTVTFTEKQKNAILNALKNVVSIITGSPGTGKTTILKCIIDCYKALNSDKEVTLLAPTGKAARRMSEATGCDAFTIHSKLGIYDEFGMIQPLDEGLIIVDESSMIDTLLMEKLIGALRGNSQIVFVGDIDQLPSVGPGAILAELIKSNVVPTSTLTEIFRQEGGTIVHNAVKINNGNTELEYDECFELIQTNSEEEAIKYIRKIYSECVTKYGIDETALLTPLRRTQNGRFACVSDELNLQLRDVVNPNANMVNSITINGVEYRVGDRVLQWKNTEKSSNGDIGVIKAISQTDEGVIVNVDWDNGNNTDEDREAMNDITHAYAMSIHKSQGSEYKCVIIPLLSQHKCRLFKRNLLYTAVTRAKKNVIIVGCKDAIDTCIKTSETNMRLTLLSKRIIAMQQKFTK